MSEKKPKNQSKILDYGHQYVEEMESLISMNFMIIFLSILHDF